MENKVLLAVDGNSVLNREYYGIPLLSTQSGIYTNGVLGFTNKLLKYIETLSPAYRFAAFDLRAPTFRHKVYEGYKASRKGMPDELAAQLPYVKEVCGVLGFEVVAKEGYEADDILGTLSKKADEAGGITTYLLTGDKDALQLVSDGTTVLFTTNNAVITYNPAKIREIYGVTPGKLIDIKALMGDSSDEIPGVKGIGEKTAVKLISENNSLNEIYKNLGNGTLNITPVNKNKLIDGRDSAYLSQKLATIYRDVPDVFIEKDNPAHETDKEKLYNFCKKLEFSSIIKRYGLEEYLQFSLF
jgi:DNA polymerase-1